MSGSNRRHRRSIRLPGWDYRSPGAYSVTITAHGRECLFGEVVDGKMVLSDFGKVVAEEWERTALVRPYVRLDAFVVMPNHVHGIVWSFKSAVIRRINRTRGTTGAPVWQRNYYERIVRNERELNGIRQYILDNPANSQSGAEHPDAHTPLRCRELAGGRPATSNEHPASSNQ